MITVQLHIVSGGHSLFAIALMIAIGTFSLVALYPFYFEILPF